jgi:8-oxo-dGTP pyrophosphatase MutT (NUDIX family)
MVRRRTRRLGPQEESLIRVPVCATNAFVTSFSCIIVVLKNSSERRLCVSLEGVTNQFRSLSFPPPRFCFTCCKFLTTRIKMIVDPPPLMKELTASLGCDKSEKAKVKLFNMIYLTRQNPDSGSIEVLLGHKARGHGAGNWNGFGGKVEKGDASIAAGVARELEEECGVKCPIDRCIRRGIIFFFYPEMETAMEVHVYTADWADCTGSIQESEEMTPIKWFSIPEIPLQSMWADDEFWLPQLLSQIGLSQQTKAGTPSSQPTLCQFIALFDFDAGFKTILRKTVDFKDMDLSSVRPDR